VIRWNKRSSHFKPDNEICSISINLSVCTLRRFPDLDPRISNLHIPKFQSSRIIYHSSIPLACNRPKVVFFSNFQQSHPWLFLLQIPTLFLTFSLPNFIIHEFLFSPQIVKSQNQEIFEFIIHHSSIVFSYRLSVEENPLDPFGFDHDSDFDYLADLFPE